MRNKFDMQLEELNKELILMGATVESAIDNAVLGLTLQSKEHSKMAVELDEQVDQMEKDIESLCMKLLLQQQPVAKDLRLISSALKMITDMERIGDQASDIAEISMFLMGKPQDNLTDIASMATATIKMVNDSIGAFVKRDLDLATSVIKYDDIVDDFFVKIKGELITLIGKDVNYGEDAMDLIMVAKYLERIGDHATNIAEWVVYSINGTH